MPAFFQNRKLAFCFLFPQLALIVVFFIWPSVNAIVQSLYFSDAFGLHHYFSGLRNYVDLVDDPVFFQTIGVTLLLGLLVTLITMTMGISLAYMVAARRASQIWYKSLFIWPYAVAPAVAAILWRFLCHPTIGWLTYLCHQIGYDFNYLTHPAQAFWVVVMVASWQQFSYNFLFYFVAIKAIPHTLIEAAILDGASPWQRFWQIIFPLLSPTTFFLLVMNLIYAFFDTFGIIDVVTRGGPENTTTTLIYKVYRDGFINMDPGSSSAQSVLLIMVVVGLTLVQFRYLEKRVHYN